LNHLRFTGFGRCGTLLAAVGTNGKFANNQGDSVLKRTLGAAIGAVIFVLFMSYIATRLTPPVSAESATPAETSAANR
jgi:hypothetical protein